MSIVTDANGFRERVLQDAGNFQGRLLQNEKEPPKQAEGRQPLQENQIWDMRIMPKWDWQRMRFALMQKRI